MAVPIDCLPDEPGVAPVYPEMYWGQGQRLLRASRRVRRDPALHALLLTSQGCGPDGLYRHFAGYLLEGKPHAVLETDGHRGTAGVRTRVEAFLHCVRVDRAGSARRGAPHELARLPSAEADWMEIARRRERVLIPSMGPGSEVAAAAFRGLGLPVESLPPADQESLRFGRLHTSGNECLPMILNLGALLRRLEAPGASTERFVYLMPRSLGPCRFGLYSLLLRLIVDRLGLTERVRILVTRGVGVLRWAATRFQRAAVRGNRCCRRPRRGENGRPTLRDPAGSSGAGTRSLACGAARVAGTARSRRVHGTWRPLGGGVRPNLRGETPARQGRGGLRSHPARASASPGPRGRRDLRPDRSLREWWSGGRAGAPRHAGPKGGRGRVAGVRSARKSRRSAPHSRAPPERLGAAAHPGCCVVGRGGQAGLAATPLHGGRHPGGAWVRATRAVRGGRLDRGRRPPRVSRRLSRRGGERRHLGLHAQPDRGSPALARRRTGRVRARHASARRRARAARGRR